MKRTLAKLAHRYSFSRNPLLNRIRWNICRQFGLEVPREIVQEIVEREYEKRVGVSPNISEPSTFNEKIQWLKLNYRNPLMTSCADKSKVREYISEKGLSDILTKLYGTFSSVTEIDPRHLPESFVIKCTHNCGGVHIVPNRTSCNWQLIKDSLVESLRLPYTGGVMQGEWHYLEITPKVFIEELLSDNGREPNDYKIHCFNGRAEFVQVDFDRNTSHTQVFYNREWTNMHFSNGGPLSEQEAEQPVLLETMLSIAERIASPFPYVRVDLYYIASRIYFGEMTFFHCTGMAPFTPKFWDKSLGDMLVLPRLSSK
jgi:hypothetical protein